MRMADNVFKYDYIVIRNLINHLKFTEKIIQKCPVSEMKKKTSGILIFLRQFAHYFFIHFPAIRGKAFRYNI